jgi:hypothetical protein
MKKLLLLSPIILGVLIVSSCNKTDQSLAENSWAVNGKVFQADNILVADSSGYISATVGNSSLNFKFKSIPTTNANYTVSVEPYNTNEVSVKTILGGANVYNSIDNKGVSASVTIVNGKYHIILPSTLAVNADLLSDTVRISANIVQP